MTLEMWSMLQNYSISLGLAISTVYTVQLHWPPCWCWRLCWPLPWYSPPDPRWGHGADGSVLYVTLFWYTHGLPVTWWCVQSGCHPWRRWHRDFQHASQLLTWNKSHFLSGLALLTTRNVVSRNSSNSMAHLRGRQWSPSISAAVPHSAPADGYSGRAWLSDSFSPL